MTKKFFDISPPPAPDAGASQSKIRADFSSPKPEGLLEKPTIFTQKKKNKGKGQMLGLLLAFLVAFGAFSSYFYLSRAEVEIWPETKNLNYKTEVVVRQGYDEPSSSWLAQKTLPGKSFTEEKESSKEFFSSGIVEKQEFARGKIRIQNKSKNPITLIKNTRFLSDEGKQFHSLKEATVPAKSYMDGVEVQADAAGGEYNVGPSKFSVPNLRKYSSTLFYEVYGESSEPMTGGFSGKSPQVTEDDLKGAEAELLGKLYAEGKESLIASVRVEDYVMPEETVKQEVIEKITFAKAGQETKSFIYKSKIKSSGLAYRESDLENLAKDFVYSQIGLDKKLVEKSLSLNYEVKESDSSDGKITVALEISADVYSDVNMQNLKNKIKGKSSLDGKNFLEKEDGISRVKVNLWPPWVKRVPKKDEKIEMKISI